MDFIFRSFFLDKCKVESSYSSFVKVIAKLTMFPFVVLGVLLLRM